MWVDDQYIAFDFETSGKLPEYALQPWRVAHNQAWATSLATVRRTEGGPIVGGGLLVAEPFTATARHIRELLITAIEHKLTLVGWNVAFDISWLLAYGFRDLVFKCKFLDGMLLWKHLTVTPEYDTDKAHKKSFSLKAAVREFMPDRGGYEEDIDFRATDPESLAKLHKYNIQDTAYTLWLTRKFYKQLEAEPARLKAALIEASCLPLVADANLRGLMLDRAALRTLDEALTADAETALAALSPYGVTEAVVRSPKQLGDLMYGQWGLPVIKQNTSKKTGKVTNSTDKEVLHELAFIDARARTIREYREALGNKTKFVDAPLESIDYNSDGCSHPLANVYSTYTGRMSYSSKQGKNKDERQIGFALHQEKRDPTYRAIVVPPQGYTLVEFDAMAQEYRWMAVASKDEAMLHMCAEGEDAHSYMGAQIAREEYRELMAAVQAGGPAAKSKRQLGKLANLSCVSEGTLILSSHGIVRIECLPADALVWDGVDWVRHGGVVFQGLREVISYAGLTATPDHPVLVEDSWVRFDQAARYGWHIKPAMGAGWACSTRAKVRVVGGLVCYGLSEIWRTLRALPVWLWVREGRKSPAGRDWAYAWLQYMQHQAQPSKAGAPSSGHPGKARTTEASQCNVPEMQQPQRAFLRKLRWAWDTLLIPLCEVYRRVGTGSPTSCGLQKSGLGPHRQQWALCSGESPACLPEAELTQYSSQCVRTVAGAKNPAYRVERKSLLNILRRTVRSCWTVWRGDYSTGMDSSGRKTQGVAHTEAPTRVYDILDCGPNNRFAANGLIVHNCGYRTSAAKLRTVARVQYDLPMELPEAEYIKNTYLRTYTGVPRYWAEQIAKVRRLGYAETFAGRQVQVVGTWSGADRWSLESTAINFPIQGTGGDQKYLALAVLRPYVVKHGIQFAWELHDGLYFYIPTKLVDKAIAEMKFLLDNLPYTKAWGFTPPVPMPWDCKVGTSWGNLKEVKL